MLASFTCSCADKSKDSYIDVSLYFSNSSKDSLVTEKASVDEFLRKDTVGFVRKIMKLLLILLLLICRWKTILSQNMLVNGLLSKLKHLKTTLKQEL